MKILKQAYENRNKKQNKIEKIKDTKDVKTVINDLEQICLKKYEDLDPNDLKYFFKSYGIFDKGDNSFMIRIRVSAGRLNNAQALAIANIAKTYGDDYIDVTTRQQIELRYIKLENLYEILTLLNNVGITTYQTGVDNLRNIVTDALDDISHDSIINTFPIIEKLQNIFLKNDEYISTLPRKFNTAILGSMTNTCNIFGHDCCFALASKDGIYGFNVYLGGRVGMQAKSANIFVTQDDIEIFFTTLLDLFKKYGFRDNRNKNRLVYLIQAVGMEEFIKALKEKANIDFQNAGVNLVSSKGLIVGNKISQKNSNFAKKVIVPAGITSGSDLIKLANVSLKYASGDLRLSYDQNIYIINIKKDNYESLLKEDILLKYEDFDNIYFNDMIACAGTKTCSFGVIPNKSDAIQMAHYLQNEVPLKNAKIRMNWSACVKGCGIHGIADIGFEGCKAKDENNNLCDGVHILLAGQITNKAKEAYTFMKSVPIPKAQIVVKHIISAYSTLKNEDENFEDFYIRVLDKYSHQALVFYCLINIYLEENNLELLTLEEIPSTLKNESFEVFDFGLKLFRKYTSQNRYSEVRNFTPTLDNKITKNYVSKLNNNVPELLSNIIYNMTTLDTKLRYEVFSEIINELEA